MASIPKCLHSLTGVDDHDHVDHEDEGEERALEEAEEAAQPRVLSVAEYARRLTRAEAVPVEEEKPLAEDQVFPGEPVREEEQVSPRKVRGKFSPSSEGPEGNLVKVDHII
jgi:hypothetical protein